MWGFCSPVKRKIRPGTAEKIAKRYRSNTRLGQSAHGRGEKGKGKISVSALGDRNPPDRNTGVCREDVRETAGTNRKGKKKTEEENNRC